MCCCKHVTFVQTLCCVVVPTTPYILRCCTGSHIFEDSIFSDIYATTVELKGLAQKMVCADYKGLSD